METYTWDTVFATTTDFANKALAASHDKLLPTFSFNMAGFQIDGAFGSWRIVGGSGKFLHLELPVQSGRMLDRSGKSFDLSNMSVVVEVQLQLLPSQSDANIQSLQFHFKTVGDNTGDATPGVVTLIQVKDLSNRLPEQDKNIFGHAIAECLVANAASVSYLFATISAVKSGANSWLNPVQSDYLYVEIEGGKTGFLAILSVIDHRDISQLERKIDPALLVGPGSGFFIISKELFLRHVIQPMLPAVFGHETTDQGFIYNTQANSIQNTGVFSTDAVQSGAFWYYPKVNYLHITVFESDLACTITGSCDMRLDINLTFGVYTRNTLKFDASSKLLSFGKDPNPTVQHDFHIPWYDYLIPGILGIGDLILGIVVPLVADGIAGGIQQNASNLSLAKEPPQAIQWQGMAGFNVTDAGLNNCFYLRGELQ